MEPKDPAYYGAQIHRDLLDLMMDTEKAKQDLEAYRQRKIRRDKKKDTEELTPRMLELYLR